MPPPTDIKLPDFKFQAFLSYSHADAAWASRLHRILESYRVDETLVGTKTSFGVVPPRLKPIFRDRESLHAGHSLSAQTEAALDASATLIVVCSPATVASKYVPEEIRYFKKHGRGDRVFALIVGGMPNDPQRECFPETLKFSIGSDGTLTGDKEEPIAADARTDGDGERVAVFKLIAGLLGVPLDKIWKREEELERRRRLKLKAVAGAFCFLALGAVGFGGWAYWEKQRNEQLTRTLLDSAQNLVGTTVNITGEYGIQTDATHQYLRTAEETYERVKAQGNAGPDLQFRTALLKLELSKVHGTRGLKSEQLGDAEKAVAALLALGKMARRDPHSLAERVLSGWHWIAGIEAGSDGAIGHWLTSGRRLEKAAAQRLPFELKRAYFVRGEAFRANSRRNEALRDFKEGLALDPPGIEQTPLRAEHFVIDAKLLLGVSNVHYASGRFAESLNATHDAINKLESLRKDIQTEDGRFELADAYITAGDAARVVAVQLHRRALEYQHLRDAVTSARRGIEEAKALYDAQPGNVLRAQLLARGHMVHGDIRKAQKQYQDAHDAYVESRDVREWLFKRDKKNIQLRYELGWSLMKIGETIREWPDRRDPVGAIKAYGEAVSIFEGLWSRGFASARKSAWWALQGMEMPLVHLGHTEKLIANMQRKLELAREAPAQAQNAVDIAVSHVDLGELFLRLNRYAEARAEFDATLAMTRPPIGTTATRGTIDRHRARAFMGLAMVALKRDGLKNDELIPAREALQDARLLADALIAASPSDIDLMKLDAEVAWQTSKVWVRLDKPIEADRECKLALQRIKDATRLTYAPNEWRERMGQIEAGCNEIIRNLAL